MTDVPSLVAQARAARVAGDRAGALALFRQAADLQPKHLGLRMEAASDLIALGQPGEAAGEYDAVLASAPDHAGALIAKGHLARRQGDRAKALACFRQAAVAEPANIWAKLEEAAEYREAGQLEHAEAGYRAVLVQAPGQSVALLGLATCARARGDLAASLLLHSQIVDAEPDHAWARLQSAADLRELGRLDEAERTYHRVLAGDARMDAALLGLGQCARRRGDRQAALAWHQLAARANPGNGWYRLECAVDLRELGELGTARGLLLTLAEAGQHVIPALLALAAVERLAGDKAAARRVLERAVAADPGNPSALLELAAEHRLDGEPAAAARLAEAVLARHPAHVGALVSLGQAEAAAGRQEQALAAFSLAQLQQPRRADLLAHMAMAERALGRQARCDALLVEALAAEPGNAAILVHQAEQARMANDIAGMHAIYADGAAANPGHLGLSLGLAESLVLLGRAPDALAQLDAVEAGHGWSAVLGLRRVSLLRRIGRWAEALAAARVLTRAAPLDASAWMERLACEDCLGSDDDVDACLAAVPAGTAAERSRLCRMRARVLEDRGAWVAAAADYRAAIALDPEHAEPHFLWTRFCLATLDLAGAREGLRGFMRRNAATFRLRGQSRHASQTHFGQLLAEYELDDVAVAAVQKAWLEDRQARTEAMLGVVAAHPHSTAAALAVMHALREDGHVTGPDRLQDKPACEPAIPRSIVQFWDTAMVPDDIGELTRSWAVLNPGYRHKVFDQDEALRFIAERYGRAAAHAFLRGAGPAQKADLFRLAYLAAEGGIYADADDRCHASLRVIVPDAAKLVLYQEDIGSIGNNFIAAAPGHPVIVRAWRLAVAAMLRGDGETVWLSTGPGLLTRALAQYLVQGGQAWPACLQTIVLLGRRALFRAVAIHCVTGYKVTDRHWSNQRSAGAGVQRDRGQLVRAE